MAPAKRGYKEDHSKGAMLRFEESLPRLPVPTLEETAKRYIKSVHPILSTSEYESTSKAVQDFIKPGGQGETLQKRLIARNEDPKHKNWLFEWWNNSAYLSYQDPVVPYVSYFYSHRDDRRRRDPAKRAAAITAAVLEFKKQVDAGELEPEYLRKEPQAMSSYHWMFNACRTPHSSLDFPVKHPAKENPYIVVARKSQFFKVFHEHNGQQLNAAELEQQFRRVYETAEPCPSVGSLTAERRNVWAESRERLIAASPANAAALKTIEAASFLVCLDDARPVTLEERAHAYWHGDGQNRWFDKPLQFIINDNGTSGFMGEHSMMDGTPTQRLNDYAMSLIVNNKLDLTTTSVRSDLPLPTALKFVTTPEIQKDISSAKAFHDTTMAQHDLRVQAYQGYGKELIKKFKCSPDAYVQMIIQLAYHKMYGKNRPTYESASTRKFAQGRTEANRTVSDECVAFCNAMADPEVEGEQCVQLFRAALKAQGEYIGAASEGKGVDRHLFGLKQLLKEGEEVPAIYKDPAYSYSSHWFLSTSQLSSEYFNGYGWSQVVDDGFGIAYMINNMRYVVHSVAEFGVYADTDDNSIQFNIVSKNLGCDRMSFFLNEAANDLREIMTPTLGGDKAKL